MVLSGKLDNKRFKTAIRPNYIHSQDSALAWWFILETSFFSVHDCFMADYKNITFMVCKINEGMNMTFHDLGLYEGYKLPYFSIFIIL